MSTIMLGILEEGLIYAIVALGIYITYRILDFPDLSVDGTFPLGGAVTAILISKEVSPVLALAAALAAGAAAGIVTGVIHVHFKVKDLLSGIIVMTALYSINIRIAGSANLTFYGKGKETIFNNAFWDKMIPASLQRYITVALLILIVFVLKLLMDLYMKTKSGYLLRAVGDNSTLVTSLAKNNGSVKILGLAIANALAALCGAIYSQKMGFFEISLGTGTMVFGLASVIIGTRLIKRIGFFKSTTAVIIGSIIYKACVSMAISFNMKASDLKLITSFFFLLILVLSNTKKRRANIHA